LRIPDAVQRDSGAPLIRYRQEMNFDGPLCGASPSDAALRRGQKRNDDFSFTADDNGDARRAGLACRELARMRLEHERPRAAIFWMAPRRVDFSSR
jgi:hypothetical protein